MKAKSIVIGVDIGSVFSKAVIMTDGQIITYEAVPSGGHYGKSAQKVITGVLSRAEIPMEHISSIVATGLGANNVSFPCSQVSDITCQARGINYLFPSSRTVIDIGGQSIKVIKANSSGNVVDFVISDRCAAGSGRFLQIISRIIGVRYEDIGPISLNSKNAVEFNTSCAVFAESEAISRIAEGALKEDILAGVHNSLAASIATLVKRISLEADCVLTGGGAEDIGLVKSITEVLSVKLLVPENQRFTAALGAACLAVKN